jgi:hypothetical protein
LLRLLFSWAILMASVYIAAMIVPGVEINRPASGALVALTLALLNAIIRPCWRRCGCRSWSPSASSGSCSSTPACCCWEVVLESTAAARQKRRDVRPRGHRGGIYPFMRGAMCVFIRDLIVYSVLTDNHGRQLVRRRARGGLRLLQEPRRVVVQATGTAPETSASRPGAAVISRRP